MRFTRLEIEGAILVQPEPLRDERGAFARVFCTIEFGHQGLVSSFTQSSVSMNTRAGTIRGMHYSTGQHEETKLVRCTQGAIEDVIVDVRPQSPSYGKTLTFSLTAANRHALYVPAGVAHGFQTLCDDVEVLYMIDRPYVAEAARGLRWNDRVVVHAWALPISTISDRDRGYPDFVPGDR